jgi:hypothetical protein
VAEVAEAGDGSGADRVAEVDDSSSGRKGVESMLLEDEGGAETVDTISMPLGDIGDTEGVDETTSMPQAEGSESKEALEFLFSSSILTVFSGDGRERFVERLAEDDDVRGEIAAVATDENEEKEERAEDWDHVSFLGVEGKFTVLHDDEVTKEPAVGGLEVEEA